MQGKQEGDHQLKAISFVWDTCRRKELQGISSKKTLGVQIAKGNRYRLGSVLVAASCVLRSQVFTEASFSALVDTKGEGMGNDMHNSVCLVMTWLCSW